MCISVLQFENPANQSVLLFITGIAHGTNALAESPDYTWKQRKQQLVRLTAHSAAC
jgi:hypothetical protein